MAKLGGLGHEKFVELVWEWKEEYHTKKDQLHAQTNWWVL